MTRDTDERVEILSQMEEAWTRFRAICAALEVIDVTDPRWDTAQRDLLVALRDYKDLALEYDGPNCYN